MGNENFSASLENSLDDGPAEETTQEESTEEESTEESDEFISPNAVEETEEPTISEVAEEAMKKYKVKVDGEEREVDEKELISNYQLRKASDKKFTEANQARKQAEEFVRLLKTDPAKVLSHPSIGADVKKFAEDYLLKELQTEMMTPEQKEIAEYKHKLALYEEQEKKTKADSEQKAKEEVNLKYAEDYNKQITGALETSGLPKTEFTVQRMIYYMHNALSKGYELEAKDVTDLVKRDYIEDTKALYSGLDADALINIIGPEVAKKLRKYDLDKIKTPKNNITDTTNVKPKEGSGRTTKPKKLTKDQWRANLAKLKD